MLTDRDYREVLQELGFEALQPNPSNLLAAPCATGSGDSSMSLDGRRHLMMLSGLPFTGIATGTITTSRPRNGTAPTSAQCFGFPPRWKVSTRNTETNPALFLATTPDLG